MDRNLLLAFALSFLVLSLWSMVQAPPPDPSATAPREEQALETATQTPPSGPSGSAERYPTLPPPRPAAPGEATPLVGDTTPRAGSPAEPGETIEVMRPLFRAELSSRGASVHGWELREYVDRHGDPIALVRPSDRVATAATPFPELGLGDLSTALWEVEERSDREVRFAYRGAGITIRKIFSFPDEGYQFRLSLEVSNEGSAAVAPAFLVELPIRERTGNDFREQNAAAYQDGELEVKALTSLGTSGFLGLGGGKGPVDLVGEVDWAGVQTPYFLSAVFPDQPSAARARFLPLEAGVRGAVQVYFEPVTLSPGQQATRDYRGYFGPKQAERLEAFAPSAVASIDLGWSIIAPMTRAFTWLLAVLYSFVPNYGWSIILLTILVRLVTMPLTNKQMRSMERMRRLQPQIKEIQEKFADDRQKQSEAMMSLYRKEKVNPLGGCLPMLLQLPVFIGLFYALRSSIQLRQAPFIGWIDDLSAPDLLFTMPGVDFPIRVLPILMGASMFVQQKLTPMQMDAAQARMMLIMMPGMMLLISYTFPSGLVLYWMMSNVLAIANQLWIGRNVK